MSFYWDVKGGAYISTVNVVVKRISPSAGGNTVGVGLWVSYPRSVGTWVKGSLLHFISIDHLRMRVRTKANTISIVNVDT